MQTFGEYIRQLRTKRKLTLTQLGAKLELDSANLSKIENGKREFDERRLILLAKEFNLDIDKLKIEYFGDIFAKKIYQSHCSTKVLSVAEDKVKYYKELNIKKEKLEL